MRTHGRYLLPPGAAAPAPGTGGLVLLDEHESRHLLLVRRGQPGDRLELFDGRGRAWRAELVESAGAAAVCRLLEELPPTGAGSAGWRLTVAAAVPQAKRMSWLVEKCAELGAEELLPVHWSRSVRAGSETSAERWRRIAEAAAKQSRQSSAMAVSEPLSVADLAARLAAFERVLLLTPDGGTPPRPALAGLPAGARLVALVGPEGGLAPPDQSAVETAAGDRLRCVTLGPAILRVETAAATICAVALSEALTASFHRRGAESAVK